MRGLLTVILMTLVAPVSAAELIVSEWLVQGAVGGVDRRCGR